MRQDCKFTEVLVKKIPSNSLHLSDFDLCKVTSSELRHPHCYRWRTIKIRDDPYSLEPGHRKFMVDVLECKQMCTQRQRSSASQINSRRGQNRCARLCACTPSLDILYCWRTFSGAVQGEGRKLSHK